MCLSDGFRIHGGECEDRIQMLVGEVLLLDRAQRVDTGEVEPALLRQVDDCLALGGRQEFALVVEKLEGVPLAGIVGGGDDDTAVSLGEQDGHLGRRRRCKSALDDIDAATDQRPDHKLFDHIARDACILADHDLVAFSVRPGLPGWKCRAVSVCKLYNVNRGEGLSGCSSDRSANAGNGFDKCHSSQKPFLPNTNIFFSSRKNNYFIVEFPKRRVAEGNIFQSLKKFLQIKKISLPLHSNLLGSYNG